MLFKKAYSPSLENLRNRVEKQSFPSYIVQEETATVPQFKILSSRLKPKQLEVAKLHI